MAKAKLSKLIESLQGEIDGLVFREMPDWSIVVSKVPKRKKRKATLTRTERSAYLKGKSFHGGGLHRRLRVYYLSLAGMYCLVGRLYFPGGGTRSAPG